MADCEICGSLRLNSEAIEKDGNGGWKLNSGALNPTRNDLKFACRSCAMELIHGR